MCLGICIPVSESIDNGLYILVSIVGFKPCRRNCFPIKPAPFGVAINFPILILSLPILLSKPVKVGAPLTKSPRILSPTLPSPPVNFCIFSKIVSLASKLTLSNPHWLPVSLRINGCVNPIKLFGSATSPNVFVIGFPVLLIPAGTFLNVSSLNSNKSFI